MPYYVFPWKSLIQFGPIKKKSQATYKLHDAFFMSDQWKTIFDKVAFKTLQMYLETSIFFSLLLAGSLNENTLWNRVSF